MGIFRERILLYIGVWKYAGIASSQAYRNDPGFSLFDLTRSTNSLWCTVIASPTEEGEAISLGNQWTNLLRFARLGLLRRFTPRNDPGFSLFDLTRSTNSLWVHGHCEADEGGRSNLPGVGSNKIKRVQLFGWTLLIKVGDDLLSHNCSTIGAVGLNFSVRNGKRWNPDAIVT